MRAKVTAGDCVGWSIQVVHLPLAESGGKDAGYRRNYDQNAVSIVIDSRHDSTQRLNESSTHCQIDEAARHRNVDDVHRPHLVRPRDLNAAHKIRVDLVARLRFGLRRRRLERFYPHPLHQRLHIPLPKTTLYLEIIATSPVAAATNSWLPRTR
jgi:hypothetical protein